MSKKVSLEAIDSILGGTEDTQESNENVETKKQPKAKGGRPRDEEYEARTFRVRKELVQTWRAL